MRRARPLIASLPVVALLCAVLWTHEPAGAANPRQAVAAQPNIVLILSDDQRADTVWAMPVVRRRLVARGVEFDHAYVSEPLCCPSRATMLTGQFAHSTGVYRNEMPMGGFPAFRDDSTLATWLHAAGYTTALVGKYLNLYEGTYIPPGWDRWVAFSGETEYYDYSLNVDGQISTFGSAASDYSTDVLAQQAESFIRSTPSSKPLLLWFAPFGPHQPATPPPRYANAFSDLAPWRPPSYNEPDVSDKPSYIASLPPLDAYKKATIDSLRVNMYRSLLAVDDAVGGILDALRETGRLRSTMIVYTSDNGFLWGEHRWPARWGKSVPYEESIRVPLVVRYDGVANHGTVVHRVVGNVDLAPTVADVAGVDAPGAEGISYQGLLRHRVKGWRPGLLLEYLRRWSPAPTYCGVRTRRYLYVAYETGEQELYDMKSDPYQLSNRSGDPALSSVEGGLRQQTETACQPPPPGLTVP
jgi:N-acetylglucosamine-6-sulfatase